ncbi:alpha/beta-hydrolase family protein [Corynebacterium sp. A21]|uniref:alpha/beta-hydrolase family protein n=1 Tax=Corynebacterium sp. A21 TaxID=3457318 RepID=UPI003FD23934
MATLRREELFRVLRNGALRASIGGLKATVAVLDIAADISPGLRITRRRRIPKILGAGILGAEITSWVALSPSLLPRRWWQTAANIAVCQAVGHAALSGLSWSVGQIPAPYRQNLNTGLTVASRSGTHIGIAALTALITVRSLQGQQQQAKLINDPHHRGYREGALGIAVGTAGYGALLLIGETAQFTTDRFSALLNRWLPGWLGWPIAAGAATYALILLSNRVVLRSLIADITRKAEELNEAVFPGTSQPWEPERSGSPWSLEPWHAVGSQGRALLSGGPRARDIAEVTRLPRTQVHEPIRIFAGMVRGRSLANTANVVLAEMDRTGAFHRDSLIINTSAGTGWVTDWGMAAAEFLTGGNCATMSMQYSFITSAVSYHLDKDIAIQAGKILIEKILARVDGMPNPPKVFVAGESLGAYGTASAFEDLADLLARTDGAVLTGAPRFTELMRRLTADRDPGSPERLPVIDGGRHVRFVAHPAHLSQDFAGLPYRNAWQHPRVIIGQHASDPVVWWDRSLLYKRPDWLREAGSRGVSAPAAQHLDVLPGFRWFPFVTGWQVGLDLAMSIKAPGLHGHNYHGEFMSYWAAVLGTRPGTPVKLNPAMERRAVTWIQENRIKR